MLKKHVGFHILSSAVLVSSQTPEPADRAAVLKQFLCVQIATRYNLCNSVFCGREEFVQTFGFFYFHGVLNVVPKSKACEVFRSRTESHHMWWCQKDLISFSFSRPRSHTGRIYQMWVETGGKHGSILARPSWTMKSLIFSVSYSHLKLKHPPILESRLQKYFLFLFCCCSLRNQHECHNSIMVFTLFSTIWGLSVVLLIMSSHCILFFCCDLMKPD